MAGRFAPGTKSVPAGQSGLRRDDLARSLDPQPDLVCHGRDGDRVGQARQAEARGQSGRQGRQGRTGAQVQHVPVADEAFVLCGGEAERRDGSAEMPLCIGREPELGVLLPDKRRATVWTSAGAVIATCVTATCGKSNTTACRRGASGRSGNDSTHGPVHSNR